LSPDYNIIRSPKSYNSQIVPICYCNQRATQSRDFEAGISTVSEMEKLANYQANHWNLTNIGTAHDEGFANSQEKNKRKLKLLNTFRF
jgi:alanine racemase